MSFQTVKDALINAFNKTSDKEFGQNGYTYITGTTVTVGDWVAIKATGTADAVFTTLTSKTSTALDGETLGKGDIYYGDFTGITLASGAVIAYKRTNY